MHSWHSVPKAAPPKFRNDRMMSLAPTTDHDMKPMHSTHYQQRECPIHTRESVQQDFSGRVLLAVRRVVGDMLEVVVMIAGSAANGSLALVVDGSLGIVGSGVMFGIAMTGATVIGHRLGKELYRRESKDRDKRGPDGASFAGSVGYIDGNKWLTTLRSACDVSGFCERIKNFGQLRSFDQKKMC